MRKLITSLTFMGLFLVTVVSAQVCNVNGGAISTPTPLPVVFCSGDGIADVLNFNVNGAVGSNYRIIYENGSGVILLIQNGNSFDFEGMGSTTMNARGISYENGLQGLTIGGNIGNLTGCYALSTTSVTVTIFSKEGGSISTNGNTTATICVDDRTADIIPITFSGFDAFGAVWAVTDLNDNVILTNDNVPNLEGTGAGVVKLRLLTSCVETFVVPAGTNISQLPPNIDASNAITITKNIGCGVTVCAPEVKPCPGKVLMCVNGVSTCVDSKQVNKLLRAGATRGGCVVCTTSSATPANARLVNPSNEEKIAIYPNPSSGSFNVRNSMAGQVKYELRSSTGKVLWSKSFQHQADEHIDISLEHLNLKEGTYYLHISNQKHHQTKRIMIKNNAQ